MRFRRRVTQNDHGPAAAAGTVAASADEIEARATECEAAGRLTEALDLLVELNRRDHDDDRDVRIRDLRRRAGQVALEGDEAGGAPTWPPVYADPFPGLVGAIPEVQAGELTTEVLGGAVAHHGALIVRGAFAADQAQRVADAIETTHRSQVDTGAAEGAKAPVGETSWYRPVTIDKKTEVLRRMVASRGGTWLADSPTSTEIVLAELEASGITRAIAGHLGERPVFSLQKSTLRRSLPENRLVAWHQDGSFMGEEIRTMNAWVALSPCGGDLPTPGLELLPRRLEEILAPDGVMSPHSVAYDQVDELAQETPTVIPRFDAGDALLFDELFLHRTHLSEQMTDIRYAIECWFFAPSHPADTYTALLV